MPAKLILTRKSEWLNRRQSYKVLIDKKETGVIKNDDIQEFVLAPGTYIIQCTHNWMSSPAKTVTLTEGVNTRLSVSNGMKYIVPLYIMMMIGIFLPVYFKFSRQPIPDSAGIIKMVLIFPALIYILTYLTVLRKRYIIISEDVDGLFK